MAEDRARQGAPQAVSVETDAVCERCGTVNAEDTLLCKACGNNLRDQRARRMANAQGYEGLDEAKPKTRWLASLLGVFGLLLIAWTALNVSRVEEWLVSAQTTSAASSTAFFSRAGGQPFEALSAEVRQNPVTQDQLNQAMAQPANPEGYEGRFAIMQRGMTGMQLVGQAVVRRDGDRLVFVAQLHNGVELRGMADVDETHGAAVSKEAALRYRGDMAEAQGYAQRGENLGYSLYGFAEFSDRGYEATAYAVPAATE